MANLPLPTLPSMYPSMYPPDVNNFAVYDRIKTYTMPRILKHRWVTLECYFNEAKTTRIIYTIKKSDNTTAQIRQRLYQINTHTHEVMSPPEFYISSDEIFKWLYDKQNSTEFIPTP